MTTREMFLPKGRRFRRGSRPIAGRCQDTQGVSRRALNRIPASLDQVQRVFLGGPTAIDDRMAGERKKIWSSC